MNINEITKEKDNVEATPETPADTVVASEELVEVTKEPVAESVSAPDPTPAPETTPAATAYTVPPTTTIYVAPTPAAPTEPPKDSPYAPIKSWGFVGIHWLLNLPFIGTILLIVWACGGCRKYQKRYYARSIILYNLLITLIFVVCTILGAVLFSDLLASLMDTITSYLPEVPDLGDLTDLLPM